MGSQTEVAADLVVNDRTAATFSKIRSGFDAINSKVDKATAGMLGFVKSTASTALGVKLAGLGGTMSGIYHEAIEAAMAAGKEEKSIAAALLMTDKKNRSYAETREEAVGLRKELRHMGMEAGISGDSVVESFTDIAARTNKTTAQTKELMASMVQAGRIVPAGLSGITSGFEMIEMGMIRARNPVVQMIASTGLLKGNARQVAKDMMKMSPEQQLAIAEKAIVRMAGKMKDVPLSFGEAVTSMKDMREELFDLVGMPIFKGFAPIMRTIREEFKAHQHEIEAWGVNAGKVAGNAILVAGGYLKDIFHSIERNWDGIAAGFSTIASTFMGVGKFLVENKDVIGRMAMMGTGSFANIAQGNPGHKSAMGMVGDVAGGAMLGGKVAGPWGAMVGAVVSGTGAMVEELLTIDAVFQKLTGSGNLSAAAVRKLNDELDKRIEKAQKESDQFAQLQGFAQSLGLTGMGQKGKEGRVTDKTANLPSDVGFQEMSQKGARFGIDDSLKAQTEAMVREFNTAMEMALASGDAGQMSMVQNILGNSKQLQYALAMSGVEVGKGFNDLIDAMVEGGKLTAEAGAQAKAMVKGGKAGDLGKLGGVHVGGGNTINVKQEFREADPDRIMLAFKAVVTKAAASRVAARVSGPFGGF